MAAAMSSIASVRPTGLTSVRRSPRAARASVAVRAEQSTEDYVKTLPGITAPFDNVFDPAGLAKTASIKDMRRWREAEVTHGRVSMLAALGFIIGEQGDGGFPLFEGEITGPAINQFQQVPRGLWESLVLVIGIAEAYRVSLGWATPTGTGFNSLKDDYSMGDLGFDPLGFKPSDPTELKVMQTKELNNGRLAMIAIAGFVAQEVADGGQVEIFEHWFSNVEKELGIEAVEIEQDLGL